MTIGLADLREKRTQGEAALHHQFGDAEDRGDVGDGLARLGHAHKGLVLGHLVGIKPGEVFEQGGFQRRRVVARLHDGAGQRLDGAADLGQGLGREVAPPPGDDFEALAIALGPHQQRHQDPPRLHARQDVGDVGHRLGMAHVGGGFGQFAEVYVLELHGSAPSFAGVKAAPDASCQTFGRDRFGRCHGCGLLRKARRKSAAFEAWLAARKMARLSSFRTSSQAPM